MSGKERPRRAAYLCAGGGDGSGRIPDGPGPRRRDPPDTGRYRSVGQRGLRGGLPPADGPRRQRPGTRHLGPALAAGRPVGARTSKVGVVKDRTVGTPPTEGCVPVLDLAHDTFLAAPPHGPYTTARRYTCAEYQADGGDVARLAELWSGPDAEEMVALATAYQANLAVVYEGDNLDDRPSIQSSAWARVRRVRERVHQRARSPGRVWGRQRRYRRRGPATYGRRGHRRLDNPQGSDIQPLLLHPWSVS